jgi:hypothetical protein
MEREPSRRAFISAVSAAAAATALAPAKANAASDQAGSAYRTAGELVPALAGRLPARPLLAERDTPTRRRRQEGTVRQPDRLGLDDNTTIAFAGLVEREFGGFTPPPSL